MRNVIAYAYVIACVLCGLALGGLVHVHAHKPCAPHITCASAR